MTRRPSNVPLPSPEPLRRPRGRLATPRSAARHPGSGGRLASPAFGDFLRERRLAKAVTDRSFSLRQLADRVGIEPSYLSKIERGEQPPPGEETIRRLADELGEDRDAVLALAGKVSGDLLAIIRERPVLVAELLRAVRAMPDGRVSEIAKEVRDGEW